MKNLIIILCAGFIFLQCSSQKNGKVDAERARIESVYKIPKFSNENAQNLAFEFASLVDQQKKKVDSGEEIDLDQLQSEGIKFADKAKTISDSLQPNDVKLLTDWSMNLLIELYKELNTSQN